MPVQVRPATADRWSDLVRVFGQRGEDPSWCWCRLFLGSATSESAVSGPRPDNRDALWQGNHPRRSTARAARLRRGSAGRMDQSWASCGLSSGEWQPSVGEGAHGGPRCLVGDVLRCRQPPPAIRRRVSAAQGGCRVRRWAWSDGCRGPSGRCGRSERCSGGRVCRYRDHGDVLRCRIHRGCTHLPLAAGDEAAGVMPGHSPKTRGECP